MSRGRHRDGEPGFTFGEHVKAELAGILRLLLRNAVRHSVPLLTSPAWTVFRINFLADSVTVLPSLPRVRVSPNVVSFMTDACPAVGLTTSVPLLSPNMARLRRDAGRPTGTLRRMPILAVANLTVNHRTQQDCFILPHIIRKQEWCPEFLHEEARVMRIPTITPVMKRLSARLATVRRAAPVLPYHLRSRSDDRAFALPIRKAPVPLHRFSLSARQRFRRALAEQSGAPADQIQLLFVFDRLNLGLYAAIRQDERGCLLCVPKRDEIRTEKRSRERVRFVSRNRSRSGSPSTDTTDVFYLIIGLRLDTGREIRALASPCEDASHD